MSAVVGDAAEVPSLLPGRRLKSIRGGIADDRARPTTLADRSQSSSGGSDADSSACPPSART